MLVATGKGIGDLLAEGCVRAARTIGQGSESFAIHVKNLELPMHDPRAFASWAVSYGTSNRGGDHIQAPTFWLERGPTFPAIGLDKISDRFSSEGKGKLTKLFQDFCEVVESAGICKFALYGDFRSHHVRSLLHYATGWDLSIDEMMRIGERSFNLKRSINVKCGLTGKHDLLPERLRALSLSEGGTKGYLPDQAKMLKDYYRERGWDEKGIPTAKKLSQLSLTQEL